MNPIYLFPHIPKTGGAALLQNAERSLPRGKFLRVNCKWRQFYHHPRTEKLCFYEKEEDFNNLLVSLSTKEKSQIQFVSGHDLFYGVHEHFPQPAKYFLFVREPIARTISLYNYQRFQHHFLKKMRQMDESHRRLALYSQIWFLIDGKVPSFEEWLEKSYNGNYPFYFTMARFLQNFGYLDVTIKEDSWDRLFEKFCFVGLTKTMNEDELFLYHEMGINRFWANRNISYPYISYAKLDKRVQEIVREKNPYDFELYERAKKINQEFKIRKKDFRFIVKRMEFSKKRAFVTEKMLPMIKTVLRPIIRPIRKVIRKYLAIEGGDFERFAPHIRDVNTALEHYRRYTLASSFVYDQSVLDLACGDGYGASILSKRAKQVIGIDCSEKTIDAAKKQYCEKNLAFSVGSMVDFSFKERKLFDVIVCFEALEHIQDHELCFKEIKKHLKKGGLLILSTPNRPVYSNHGKNKNPYHLKELDFNELKGLFEAHFDYLKFYGQKTIQFSHVFPLDETPNRFMDFAMRDLNPPYFFCLASDKPIDDSAGRFYYPDPRFPDCLP